MTVVGDCSEHRFGIRDGCSNSLWIGCSARRLSVRDGSQKIIKTHAISDFLAKPWQQTFDFRVGWIYLPGHFGSRLAALRRSGASEETVLTVSEGCFVCRPGVREAILTVVGGCSGRRTSPR